MLAKLHERLGDFWWYSLMIFCACRAADVLNAFVGLWLVPKYVDPSELGAVQPLAQFANFLAIPVAVFANTFRNELTRLSIERAFGKLKTLMRGVFVATAVFLFLAIVVARFVLPAFLERIRIVEGSLGLLIIAASFVGTVAPIYSNALQALKKFKAQAILNIAGAPVRFAAMLVAMPFRALSGYFVGQAASPLFTIGASVVALRKELSAPAEIYWTRDIVRRFTRLFTLFLVGAVAGGVYMVVESTVLRQRLPDIDSAGYYMATRFSEIANLLAVTLSFTLFPFTAEKAASGRDYRPLVLKALAVNAVFCLVLALFLGLFGRELLSLLPHGDKYAAYWWAIPWLVGMSFLGSVIGFFLTAEASANRFGFLKWMVPFDLAYPALLLLVTGYGYYAAYLPESWAAFLDAHNIRSLDTMLWWMTAATTIKAIGCLASWTAAGGNPHPRQSRPELDIDQG
ncbi:MAG: hypothetical protein IJ146_09905 [Kiritimatiellae bacterium]|nr:hypothetical protein [Kiritimatiellia bacterium]